MTARRTFLDFADMLTSVIAGIAPLESNPRLRQISSGGHIAMDHEEMVIEADAEDQLDPLLWDASA